MDVSERIVYGMILPEESQKTCRKHDRSALLSNANPIPNGRGLKPDMQL
jgi:hypothetical protein